MSDLNLNILSDITTFTKYSKYLPSLSRREAWEEMCTRNMNMHIRKYPFLREEIQEVYTKYIFTKKVLMSMRSAQFAGPPIEINESRIYNCSYLPIDSWESFHEIMFLLLGGSGVGYSVQKHHINKLPSIRKPTKHKKFVIQDDIIGWSDAVKALMRSYLDGFFYPNFCYSDIRPKGTPLKTSGGKAPGPGPLKLALTQISNILENKNNGERLTSLEIHDIICHISDAVLSGGIRRAALIVLFNIDDHDMLWSKGNFKVNVLEEAQMSPGVWNARVETLWNKKEHQLIIAKQDHYEMLKTKSELPWWYFEPQRGRANNSAVFIRHKGTKRDFKAFWNKVETNNSGEPGIFFSNNPDWGGNPCLEVSLRPYQFCNLTEISGKDIVNQDDLNERARAASFIGTLQAGYIDLHYLRDIWIETTERDSLIGVGITGIAGMQLDTLSLEESANIVLKENERVADILGIKKAARCNVIKPSGTTSLVLGVSSGAHPWFSPYYIRRMKVNKTEPIYQYLKEKIPNLLEDDHFNPQQDAFILIPIAAPDGAIVAKNEVAIQFLERVKKLHQEWIKPGHRKGDNTNNVSATVYVRPGEWEEVGEWMWINRDHFNGLAVLPFDGGSYLQAPHEEITKERFEELSKHLTNIDLTQVREVEDKTTRKEELACSNGVCEREY